MFKCSCNKEDGGRGFYIQRAPLKSAPSGTDRPMPRNHSVQASNRIDAGAVGVSTLTPIGCRDAIQRGTALKAESGGCNATSLVDNLDSGQTLE